VQAKKAGGVNYFGGGGANQIGNDVCTLRAKINNRDNL
jgi:hypothetical protein